MSFVSVLKSRAIRVSALLCAGLFVVCHCALADPADAQSANPKSKIHAGMRKPDPLTPEAARTAEKLKIELLPGSEARMTLDAILDGKTLGPGEGWFRTALSQTRYRWADVKKRYDRNQDDRVDRKEFPGSNADFARLDLNQDGAITAVDMDWSTHALEQTPANRFYNEADRDGDGKLSREEFAALFDQWDKQGDGFLSLDDLARHLNPPAPQRRRFLPSTSQLVLGLARQEVGAHNPGPMLNDAAPGFQLPQLGSSKLVNLADVVGKKPVVLVFGNITCGPFRSHGGNIEKLYRRYHDRAEFLMVYVREAHPTDGWSMESNDRVGVSLAQPRTAEVRTAVAARCQSMLKLSLPVLVDTMEDTVGRAYSGLPGRLYVIDKSGKIAYKGGRGPFGFKPGECEQALIFLLAEGSPAK